MSLKKEKHQTQRSDTQPTHIKKKAVNCHTIPIHHKCKEDVRKKLYIDLIKTIKKKCFLNPSFSKHSIKTNISTTLHDHLLQRGKKKSNTFNASFPVSLIHQAFQYQLNKPTTTIRKKVGNFHTIHS